MMFNVIATSLTGAIHLQDALPEALKMPAVDWTAIGPATILIAGAFLLLVVGSLARHTKWIHGTYVWFTTATTAVAGFAAWRQWIRIRKGAFTAIADDATAPYWNPAGMVYLPYREVVAGTMITGDGIAEIGIRLGLKPSLTQSQDEFKRLERAIQSVLRELVPEGERLRLMVRCGPSTRAALEGYRSGLSHCEALGLVRASRLEMLERLIREEQLLTWDVCLSLTLGKSRRTTAPYFPLLLLRM